MPNRCEFAMPDGRDIGPVESVSIEAEEITFGPPLIRGRYQLSCFMAACPLQERPAKFEVTDTTYNHVTERANQKISTLIGDLCPRINR